MDNTNQNIYNPKGLGSGTPYMNVNPYMMYPMNQLPYQSSIPQPKSFENSTLYVGDLQDQIEEELLFNFFSRFGVVFKVSVAKNRNRKSKGFGFVTYKHKDEAERAQKEANHQNILDRPIRVLWKKNMWEVSKDANVFLKNIDPSATSQDLEEVFKEFGNVFSCKIARSSDGTSLGYGYVQFESKAHAENCINKAGNGQKVVKLKNYYLEVQTFVQSSLREKDKLKNNLYIKNLPDGMGEEELTKKIEELFGKWKISSVIVKKNKENKLFAFVCFENGNQAQEAKLLYENKDPLDSGMNLLISWAEKKAERARKLRAIYNSMQNESNLFTKNLRPDVSLEEVKNAFQNYGEISNIAIRFPKKAAGLSDQPIDTQYGFINFINKEDAKNVMVKAKEDPKILSLYKDQTHFLTFFLNKTTYENFKKTKQTKMRMKESAPQSEWITTQVMQNPINPYQQGKF